MLRWTLRSKVLLKQGFLFAGRSGMSYHRTRSASHQPGAEEGPDSIRDLGFSRFTFPLWKAARCEEFNQSIVRILLVLFLLKCLLVGWFSYMDFNDTYNSSRYLRFMAIGHVITKKIWMTKFPCFTL